MTGSIERDRRRFQEIVKGRLRKDLRKYITHDEMIGRRGRDLVSIPVPQLDIPHFHYGDNQKGGVGQGDGEPGDVIGSADDGEGTGVAGNDPGRHILEVEISMDELAQMLGDSLELPRIEPRGESNIDDEKTRYNSIRRTGPESLRHAKRTFLSALRRQVSAGEYNAGSPTVVPYKEDRRYRSWSTIKAPVANALIVYMMDVSGSMSDDQKGIVRTTSFWIDTWLKGNYEQIERRYIIHDARAKEVDEHTFYHTRESGGTKISSAYDAAIRLLTQFSQEDWNIYLFQFSDGDNWSDDTERALGMLQETLLPAANLFCYGQVLSHYGSGDFLRVLHKNLPEDAENVVLHEIPDRDGIVAAIQSFLGKGK